MQNFARSDLAVAARDNDELVLSDRPGLRLTFNQATINRLGVTL